MRNAREDLVERLAARRIEDVGAANLDRVLELHCQLGYVGKIAMRLYFVTHSSQSFSAWAWSLADLPGGQEAPSDASPGPFVDEHHFGLWTPSYEAAEAASEAVILALHPLAQRRGELLVRDQLALGLEVWIAGNLDREIQEPERVTIFVPAGVMILAQSFDRADQRRLEPDLRFTARPFL